MGFWQFPKYVSVAEKRLKAEKKRKQLLKKNLNLHPVEIEGGALATTWWGKSWNKNLERYADYENRIGRGRSYVRHGAVLDLQIAPGEVTALVQGSASSPYDVTVKIKKISTENWQHVKGACEGKFDSLQALLEGKFPKALEMLFTEKGKGLFPTPDEISFSCSCPDWASMCKHVAAVLYGIGARLDEDPRIFFELRNGAVDELISQAVAESSRDLLAKAEKKTGRILEDADLSDVFGIDLDVGDEGDQPIKENLEESVAKPKGGIPSGGKEKKTSAGMETALSDIDRVETLIGSSKKSVTTAEIVAHTGLDTMRVRYLVARLKSQGKIAAPEWGRYICIRATAKKTRKTRK